MSRQDGEQNNFLQQDIEQQDNKQNTAGVPGWFAAIVWLLLGGLFMTAWPIVMFVSIFLFDAPGERPAAIRLLVMGAFCYPGVYISCLTVAITMLMNRSKANWGRFYHRASFYAFLPVLYVCALIGIGYLGFWEMGRL